MTGAPEGRYGRPDDAGADRRLKIIGSVLGAAMLAYLGWAGWDAVAGTDASGQLIRFRVVSEHEVQAHLEVRKEEDVTAVCTVRSLAADKDEVGVRDVRIGDPVTRVDRVVTIRTTSEAVSAELLGCEAAG